MSSATATALSLPDDLLDATVDHGWARDWLEANGLPDPKAEAWRYTPLAEIFEALVQARPSATGDAVRHVAPDTSTMDALIPRHDAVRLAFVNGRFSTEFSDLTETVEDEAALPPGVRLGPLSQLIGSDGAGMDELLGRWASPRPEDYRADDGLRVLNAGSPGDPAVVMVNPGVAVGTPIHVVHVRTAPSGSPSSLSQPETVIDVGAGASCRVIETHVSVGGGVTNAVTRVRTGVDAHLYLVRLQNDDVESAHVGDTSIEAHRGSYVESTSINLGAGMSRNAINVAFAGEHASAVLSGLTMLNGHQRCDTMLNIDHLVPNCSSSQDFRSVIDDRARSSFCGHVLVEHGAIGTDSSQSNRNLVLSRTAQADTRPWLEILADDVKCTHGATVGRLDDTALFYMRSRGIPLAKARSMLIGAFAAEVVDALEPASLRKKLHARIDQLDAGAHGSPSAMHD